MFCGLLMYLQSRKVIRDNIGQARSKLDLRDIMDIGKILIVDIPQGKLGISRTKLIGAHILSQVHLTALERGARGARCHLYVDYCHLFRKDPLAQMYADLGGAGFSVTAACQHLGLLDREFQEAVIGTVGTLVGFRTGITDSDRLGKEFGIAPGLSQLHKSAPYEAWAVSPYGNRDLNMPPLTARRYPSSPKRIERWSHTQYTRPQGVIDKEIEDSILSTKPPTMAQKREVPTCE